MIYLIEDRKDRPIRKQFEKELSCLLDEYSIFFKEADFTPDKSEGLESYIDKKFKNAEVVIFHKSHYILNYFKLENIKKIFKSKNLKHFVEFSGGNNTNNLIGQDASISATTLYSDNLVEFVKYFKEQKEYNLSILAFGKEYLSNEILGFSYMLHNYLASNQKIDKSDIIDIIEDTIISKELQEDKEKLIQWIEKKDNLSKELQIKAIHRFLEKYENTN